MPPARSVISFPCPERSGFAGRWVPSDRPYGSSRRGRLSKGSRRAERALGHLPDCSSLSGLRKILFWGGREQLCSAAAREKWLVPLPARPGSWVRPSPELESGLLLPSVRASHWCDGHVPSPPEKRLCGAEGLCRLFAARGLEPVTAHAAPLPGWRVKPLSGERRSAKTVSADLVNACASFAARLNICQRHMAPDQSTRRWGLGTAVPGAARKPERGEAGCLRSRPKAWLLCYLVSWGARRVAREPLFRTEKLVMARAIFLRTRRYGPRWNGLVCHAELPA